VSATAALDRQLLARADLLLLLASWLRLAPAAETRPASPAELEELAAACGLGSELAPELTGLAAARRASSSADWSAECTGLFEGGCLCPVNETAYVRRDKGAILADLAGFYRAFGFAPAADVGEKPDHIVSELQFTALLLVMLARARDADDDEAAGVTYDALRAFADDHLGAWVGLFCERLAATAGLPALAGLAALLAGTWRALAAEHGFAVTIATDDAMPGEDPGATPYECDGCPVG
jgi:TorA maturation chaperone TorD